MVRRALGASLIGTVLALPACFSLDGHDGPVEHRTYVDDWRDEVIYQVLTDRFANGDTSNDWGVRPADPARYHGGDWKGLEERLDYIQALGATAIWISPIIKNVDSDASIDGYHGYWTQDLTKLNPHMGDMAALRSMVEAAHARNIKVILDIVTNHVGQVFYYDINGNGQPDEAVWGGGMPGSPIEHRMEYDPDYEEPFVMSRTSLGVAGPSPVIFFRDAASNHMPPVSGYPENSSFDVLQDPNAYHRRGRVWNWDEPNQVVFGDFPGGLKDVATEVQAVRDAMFYAYARWLNLVDFDGFRIDTLKHVEHGFWQDFAPRIRRHAASLGKKKFFMFGEAFSGDDQLIGSYTFDEQVDSVFYFSQKYRIDTVFKYGGSTVALKDLFDQRAVNYGTKPHENGVELPPTKVLVNFLDNHDVARFLYDKPSVPALHSALLFLLTEDGIPCIYYGTEQQFAGGNDPANREDLWAKNYDTSGETFRFIASVLDVRRRYEALRRGDMEFKMWTEDQNGAGNPGILAYERFIPDSSAPRVLVVINTHDDAAKETIDPQGQAMAVGYAPGTVLVNVHADADPTDEVTVASDGTVRLSLGPRAGKIFVPKGQ